MGDVIYMMRILVSFIIYSHIPRYLKQAFTNYKGDNTLNLYAYICY